ncbi:hypothetical protein PUV54_09855 [Hyphococcus flavus]|uniref:Uncharacterized protein n=1 Tax=Hyphococcus flavus TaxID=1866326 RepID=A0AAE9ZCA1_9PROT|nr:hypothetical protein [Hyphococcus flavus]WDI30262.1 hypothetical protein PUV54_09855 [Hyphococcus flavus]
MTTKNAFSEFVNDDAPEPAPSPWLNNTDNQFLTRKSALHWARHDYWRLWEAMLLILGLSPEYYSRYDSHYNKKQSTSSLNTGLGSLLQLSKLDMALERYCALSSSDKLNDWLYLYDILQRSDQFKEEQIRPTEFIAWAKLKHLEVNNLIEEAVTTICGPLPIWGYEKIGFLDEAGNLEEGLDGPKWLRGVARLEKPDNDDKPKSPENAKAKPPADLQGELKPKERDSLLKLVIGMAVEQYGYTPDSSRNAATKHIETDLRAHGVPLDRNTILKWLREGAELLPKA